MDSTTNMFVYQIPKDILKAEFPFNAAPHWLDSQFYRYIFMEVLSNHSHDLFLARSDKKLTNIGYFLEVNESKLFCMVEMCGHTRRKFSIIKRP